MKIIFVPVEVEWIAFETGGENSRNLHIRHMISCIKVIKIGRGVAMEAAVPSLDHAPDLGAKGGSLLMRKDRVLHKDLPWNFKARQAMLFDVIS